MHGRRWGSRPAVLAGVIGLVWGCAAPAPSVAPASIAPASSAPESIAPAPTISAAAAWYEALPPCDGHLEFRCGTLDVPIDRADPGSATIPLAYYVKPHTSTTEPPLEPVFSVPGGPGYSAFGAALILAPTQLNERHDIVMIDPRGVGRSGAIDCPELQAGTADRPALMAATKACADHLGGDADRYGSGDVALDLEALRQALGFDQVSLLGFSYGSQSVEGYAARFPERVRGLIIESGILAGDPQQRWGWDPGKPRAWIDILATVCAQMSACAALYPDPATMIDDLFAQLREQPVTGTVGGQEVTVDELALANLLGSVGGDGPGPAEFLEAVKGALAGSGEALTRLVGPPTPPSDQGPVTEYSAGLGQAAWCTDVALAWDRSDPVDVRREKLDAAIKALPKDAFEPVSVDAWMDWAWPDSCVEWPAPDRYEPVIPDGARISVPTLILAGTMDTVVTGVQVDALRAAIPGSIVVMVPGAGHGTTWGPGCSQAAEVTFLETLTVDPAVCGVT